MLCDIHSVNVRAVNILTNLNQIITPLNSDLRHSSANIDLTQEADVDNAETSDHLLTDLNDNVETDANVDTNAKVDTDVNVNTDANVNTDSNVDAEGVDKASTSEDEVVALDEESVRCITSAYVHMNNSGLDATDGSCELNTETEESVNDASLAVQLGDTEDRGMSESKEVTSAAVEVAEESVVDLQEEELQRGKSAGNEPSKKTLL